ncbi:MAG: nucleotidyl transferase AbiEii/AbiGii toxin family protein [Myxococcales bacterium]|nr:nucleotidyl transferase AbiEii/AbiGii toxin family protein [Myxococcales bacterium]
MLPRTPHHARHRMLEGLLWRVAQHPDAEAFVLRGGLLVRRWFSELDRPALDVDLVCDLPYDAAAMRQRVAEILSVRATDGVRFHVPGFRLDATWAHTEIPGFKLKVAGWVDGRPTDVTADLTFRLPVWPAPVRTSWEGPGGAASLRTCQPQTLIGRKLQVVAELGRRYWRPKDLNDARLLLRRFELSRAVLDRSLQAAFEGYAETLAEVREAFSRDGWWHTPQAEARWEMYLEECHPSYDAPDDLDAAVGEVRQRMHGIV